MKVELIDSMGTDLSVVNAARVSFHKEHGEFVEGKDDRLILYLAKHGHWTPFSHTAITLRVKAPIFVARQLFKHKVGLTENEVSRRYVDEEPEFYVPEVWRGRPNNKKQGSSEDIITKARWRTADNWYSVDERMAEVYTDLLETYEDMIKAGIAPEQARMILPLSTYTEWYWTGSVAAFARVYNLRIADDAQQETREIAEQIGDILSPLFPVSWEALTKHEQSS